MTGTKPDASGNMLLVNELFRSEEKVKVKSVRRDPEVSHKR